MAMRMLVKILAFLAAVDCILVAILFGISQSATSPGSSIWPLPGLYLLEIALLGLIGFVAAAWERIGSGPYGWLHWAISGILLTFVGLGAWTIGLYLIPACLGFLAIGLLLHYREKNRILLGIAIFFLSAIIQGLVIFVAISVS